MDSKEREKLAKEIYENPQREAELLQGVSLGRRAVLGLVEKLRSHDVNVTPPFRATGPVSQRLIVPTVR